MCEISRGGHEMHFYESYEQYVDSLANNLIQTGNNDFLLTGSRERIIYTYKKDALERLSLGQHFGAQINHNTTSLKSSLTGYVWNREDTSRAISYNDSVFGTFHAFEILDLEKAMKEIGWKLSLDCCFKEYYSGDWPEIVTYTPTESQILTMADIIGKYKTWPIRGNVYARDEEIRKKEEREKSIRERTGSRSTDLSGAVEVVFPDTSDRVTDFVRNHVGWRGKCIVKLNPPAPPSKAKPRPYLELSGSSPEIVYMSRIARKEYPLLVSSVGAELYVSVELLFEEAYEGGRYRLTIAP